MQIALELRPVDQIECGSLVIPVFEQQSSEGGLVSSSARKANELTGGWIEQVYRSGEFSGKTYEVAVLHRPAGLKAARLVVVGAGKISQFNDIELRRVAGAAVRAAKKGSSDIAFALDTGAAYGQVVAAVQGAVAGDFEPDQYKTEKDNGKLLERFTVAVPGGDATLEIPMRQAQAIAEAQNFARSLVNEPANRMTPTLLAERARAMAQEQGLECEVLDQDRMRQLGMGALLGVAQGSAEPPVTIILRYAPAGAPAAKDHLAFIGKGVTFDSGGISIKPSEGMEKMKYDMAGGASVIGAMRAIAQLRPNVPVTAIIPAVENMPGSKAQRPGDIVTTLSGKTVEVLNTDAEGRLILADAITYAKRLGCTHIVNAATLTGAIVVALGHVNVGVFTNNEDLLAKVMAAARNEGEKMWPMPLDEEYKEQLKSAFADLPNIGTRWGGAITAAMFLKQFADPAPWVHLDIAGTAWLDESKPYMAKGPSGVTVRTFVNLAMTWQ